MPKPYEPKAPGVRRFRQEQYDLLKRCSDTRDITAWNQWRKDHPQEEVLLDGADLADALKQDLFANIAAGKTNMPVTILAHTSGAFVTNSLVIGSGLYADPNGSQAVPSHEAM